jgi:hypothetical protein
MKKIYGLSEYYNGNDPILIENADFFIFLEKDIL